MPCTSQTDSLIPCISGEIFFFFVPQVQLWSQMMGSEITWCLSLQGELCRKLLVLRDPSSYQRKRSSRDRSFTYLCCCSRREREATVKECVAQSLVSPGCGMLANTTGFSLKKNEPVSHCCVMTSQTNRHPLWITHLCLKLGQARTALGLALSSPSAVLEMKGGLWAAELLPWGLVQVLFPSPAFLWLPYLNQELQVSLCSCDWKNCKIICSIYLWT